MSYDLDPPEGLLGCKLAFEGMSDAMTILNGPTGCKYYPSATSESTYRNRPDGKYTFNPYRFRKEFFFSQPRIPCTYMDGNDYIMGTRGRLNEAVNAVMELDPKMICIINSPGASLIGEDLSLTTEPKMPIVRIESPEPSVPMCKGFQNGIISMLESSNPKRCDDRDGVNLIGISIWHLGWDDSVEDLKELLALCDIKVNAVAGAGWSYDDMMSSGSAELNVIVHEEFGKDVAEWYQRNLNIPYVNPPCPLGFDALEGWVVSICEALGRSPENALAEIRRKRMRAARILDYLASMRRSPRGRTFAVSADGSMAFGIIRFMYEYIGMVPTAVSTGMDDSWNSRITEYLDERNIEVDDDPFDAVCDIMVSDEHMITSSIYRNLSLGGVAVSRPGMDAVDIIERPVLGLGGTMRLLDTVINILEKSRFL